MRQGMSRQAECLPSLLCSGIVKSTLNLRRKTYKAGPSKRFVRQGSKFSHGSFPGPPRLKQSAHETVCTLRRTLGNGTGLLSTRPHIQAEHLKAEMEAELFFPTDGFPEGPRVAKRQKEGAGARTPSEAEAGEEPGLRLPLLPPHSGLPATPERPRPEPWMRKRGPGETWTGPRTS